MKKQRKCGNQKFYALKTITLEVITDGDGCFLRYKNKINAQKNIFEDNTTPFDTEPFGPFVCTKCGAQYQRPPASCKALTTEK